MNPAIEMIIEALETRPDDFFGPISGQTPQVYDSPRLRYLERMMDRDFAPRRDDENAVRVADESVEFWFLTPYEREALQQAFTAAKRERFTATTVYNMMRPNDEKEEQTLRYSTQSRHYGKSIANSMVGTQQAMTAAIQASFVTGTGITNINPRDLYK
jgi:hypothetical protein